MIPTLLSVAGTVLDSVIVSICSPTRPVSVTPGSIPMFEMLMAPHPLPASCPCPLPEGPRAAPGAAPGRFAGPPPARGPAAAPGPAERLSALPGGDGRRPAAAAGQPGGSCPGAGGPRPAPAPIAPGPRPGQRQRRLTPARRGRSAHPGLPSPRCRSCRSWPPGPGGPAPRSSQLLQLPRAGAPAQAPGGQGLVTAAQRRLGVLLAGPDRDGVLAPGAGPRARPDAGHGDQVIVGRRVEAGQGSLVVLLRALPEGIGLNLERGPDRLVVGALDD